MNILDGNFTFRHVRFVMDEEINSRFWKEYGNYMAKGGASLRFIQTYVPYDCRLLFRKETRDDVDATFFSGLRKLDMRNVRLTAQECSYMQAYATCLFDPGRKLNILQKREKLEAILYKGRFEEKDIARAYMMLIGDYMRTGKPIPMRVMERVLLQCDSLRELYFDEIQMQYQEDHDTDRFIELMSIMETPLRDTRNLKMMKYFLEHIPESGSDTFLALENVQLDYEPTVVDTYSASWCRMDYKMRMESQKLVGRYDEIRKSIYDRLKPTIHSYVYDAGSAFEGAAIISDHPYSNMLGIFCRRILGYLEYLSAVYSVGGYPQRYCKDDRLYSTLTGIFPDWIGDPSFPFKVPDVDFSIDMEQWCIPDSDITVIQAPTDDTKPVFQKNMTYDYTFFECLEKVLQYRIVIDWSKLNGSSLDERIAYLTGHPCIMDLSFNSRKEILDYHSILLDTYCRVCRVSGEHSDSLWKVLCRASSLWHIPIDMNAIPISSDNISDLEKCYRMSSLSSLPDDMIVYEACNEIGSVEHTQAIFDELGLKDVFVKTVNKVYAERPERKLISIVKLVYRVFSKLLFGDGFTFYLDDKEEREGLEEYVGNLIGGDSDKYRIYHLLDAWEDYDFKDCIRIPKKQCSVIPNERIVSRARFFGNLDYLDSLEITDRKIRKQSFAIDIARPFQEQSRDAVEAYARWRKSYLEGLHAEVLHSSWIEIMMAELTYVADEDRLKAVSAMMGLLEYKDSSLPVVILCYLLVNDLPVPMALIEAGNPDLAMLKEFRISLLEKKKEYTFEDLDLLADGRLDYEGPVAEAMKYILPKAYSVFIPDGFRRTRKSNPYLFYCTSVYTSFGDMSGSIRIPVHNLPDPEIMNLWKAIHSIIYDVVNGLGPHAIAGYTERECFAMRTMVWNNLFLNEANRNRFFPDYRISENTIWPYNMAEGLRNEAGARPVYASYFLLPDTLRYAVYPRNMKDFVVAAENHGYYDSLLLGNHGWDSGIALAAASACDDMEYYGELAYRMFGRDYHSSMTKEDPDLFRAALAIALKAFIEYGIAHGSSGFNLHYIPVDFGSNLYGYTMECGNYYDDLILRMADNACRKLKGKTLLKSYSTRPVHDYIKKELDVWIEKGGRNPYQDDRIKLSQTMLEELRRSSEEVREALRTEEDEEKELVSQEDSVECSEDRTAKTEDSCDPDSCRLTSVEESVLVALLADGDAEGIAEANFTTLDIVFDSINEKALDVFGEAVISEDGEIYDDYIEALREMVGL